MQISCQFASDFFEKRLHCCITIALQKSCDKPANRRAASDEKPTPVLLITAQLTKSRSENVLITSFLGYKTLDSNVMGTSIMEIFLYGLQNVIL